jgi:hypothetical protein
MDIFATAVLNRTVEALDQPSSFLLDKFFPFVQTDATSEEIKFDVIDSKPRITPFVHPTKAGIVVNDQGYKTQSFKPAYVKDKRRFNPNQPLRRMAGEQIGGTMTPQQRREAQVAMSLKDQLDMLTRREEVMASEVLRTGKVTVKGEGYPEVVVDFGRHADLTAALGGSVEWGDAGVKPMDDLETFATAIQGKSGAVAKDVVMDPKAWNLFRNDADVKVLLDRRAYMNYEDLSVGPMIRGQGNQKARYVGTIGDFDIWVYQDIYVDDDGNTQQMMPDYTVAMAASGVGGSGGLEGARAYGVIQDEKAGYKAERYFVKSWMEEDPAVRWLLLQSAPLVFPYRPNASGCWKVKT